MDETMTPERLNECLTALGWSQRELARRCGADSRTVRRWASGVYDIPWPVARHLELLVAFMLEHPMPAAFPRGAA